MGHLNFTYTAGHQSLKHMIPIIYQYLIFKRHFNQTTIVIKYINSFRLSWMKVFRQKHQIKIMLSVVNHCSGKEERRGRGGSFKGGGRHLELLGCRYPQMTVVYMHQVHVCELQAPGAQRGTLSWMRGYLGKIQWLIIWKNCAIK